MSVPRIIFMGTPAYAVPALDVLARRDDIELALVVTQPDRPAGRGKALTAPAVKSAAEQHRLPLLQTDSLRYAEVKERITALQPDLIVVAAFGIILGKWILELPTHGCVNLHASLLPLYRGASPICAAILAGEAETGVTLMQMDRGLDTGDILSMTRLTIAPDDTTLSLTPRLAAAGAALLDRDLGSILSGTLSARPQPDGATETRQLTKQDGYINWTQPAVEIERQVRAMWDWPRASAALPAGERVQIHRARAVPGDADAPGTVRLSGAEVQISTGDGLLVVEQAQFSGGKPLSGDGLRQRFRALEGDRLA